MHHPEVSEVQSHTVCTWFEHIVLTYLVFVGTCLCPLWKWVACAALSLVFSACAATCYEKSWLYFHSALVSSVLLCQLTCQRKSMVMKWGLLSLDVMSLSRIRCCPQLSRCCRIAAPRSSWSDCRLSKSPRLAAAVLVMMMAASRKALHMEVRVLSHEPLTGSLDVTAWHKIRYITSLLQYLN